jgi:integrase/recombinase XerC
MDKNKSSVPELVEEFLSYQKNIRNLSDNSIHGYRLDLQKLMEITEAVQEGSSLTTMTLSDLRSCVGVLSREKKSPASINRFIAAVRNFFAYCYRFGYISSNPSLELKTVKMPQRIPRYMTEDEVDALCEQPSLKPLLWESRDKALFELLYSSGCRVSELSSMRMEDLGTGYSSAMITGKGKKDRRIFFSKEGVLCLKKYLVERKELLQKHQDGLKIHQVFLNKKGTALTARGIRYIVSRYSSLEGTNKPVSPHSFRHTFATTMLTEGADVRVVQELLGHSSISTTQRYTHVTKAQLIDIYNRAHPHGSI